MAQEILVPRYVLVYRANRISQEKGVSSKYIHPTPESAAEEENQHWGDFQSIPFVISTLIASNLSPEQYQQLLQGKTLLAHQVFLYSLHETNVLGFKNIQTLSRNNKS